jgi:carbon monoxide dehydrogenase subunit G
LLPLLGILPFEALQHCANAIVKHGFEPILPPVQAELTIEIARAPEEVFAYLTDASNLPAWQSGVRSAEVEDGRIVESRSFLGRELQTTLEVVEQEKPRLFTLKALDSPVPFTVRHELEPADDGGTLLRVVADGDVPGFASGLVAQRAKRQFRKDFTRLKEILESPK